MPSQYNQFYTRLEVALSIWLNLVCVIVLAQKRGEVLSPKRSVLSVFISY